MGLKLIKTVRWPSNFGPISAARATEHDGPAVPAVGPVLPVCHTSPPAHLHSIGYPTTPPCSLPLTTDCPPTPHTHHQRRTAPARCADPPAHQPGACPGGVQDADEPAKAVQRRPCAGHPRARRDPKHRDTHEATRGPCRVYGCPNAVLRPST